MNKFLFATTAAAALMALSVPASAQLTVTLGGSVNFQAGFWDNDQDDQTGREFRNDTEVLIRADGKADNGLLYGVHIEIESQDGATNSRLGYDEANLYIAGSWGRIELGDQDGASDQLAVYAPVIGIGQVDGDFPAYVDAGVDLYALDSGDATKITYFTPTFAGFRAGISYAPEDNQGDSVIQNEGARGDFRDSIEAGLSYSGEFSDVAVAASATYSRADNTAPGEDDISSWHVGAQVGYAGFTVGGAYIDMRNYDYDNAWNAGVTYANGPFAVGLSFARGNGAEGVSDQDVWGVGASYAVAPGVEVAVDYNRYDFSDGGDEGNVVILMTKVTF